MEDNAPARISQEPTIPDPAQAHKLIKALFEPTDLIEFRPIESWTSDDGHRRSRAAPSIWVTAGNIDSVLRQLVDLNATEHNVYFGVCPRADRTRGKAGVRVVRAL